MKELLCIIVLIFFLTSCSQNTPETEWIKKGTLHKKTIREWKKASDENKLATCADFMANLKEVRHENYISIEEMKYDANNLKICIDESISSNNHTDNIKVSEVAALCYILMRPQ